MLQEFVKNKKVALYWGPYISLDGPGLWKEYLHGILKRIYLWNPKIISFFQDKQTNYQIIH